MVKVYRYIVFLMVVAVTTPFSTYQQPLFSSLLSAYLFILFSLPTISNLIVSMCTYNFT